MTEFTPFLSLIGGAAVMLMAFQGVARQAVPHSPGVQKAAS